MTQFKIEFLLLFTGCRKVLGKMAVVWKGKELEREQLETCLISRVFPTGRMGKVPYTSQKFVHAPSPPGKIPPYQRFISPVNNNFHFITQ